MTIVIFYFLFICQPSGFVFIPMSIILPFIAILISICIHFSIALIIVFIVFLFI